jgi:predicted HD phosphohydrolase
MPTWQAPFKRLQDATGDEVQRLMAHDLALARGLPGRVLEHLKLLDSDAGGWPVNRYTHSLLAATLALQDGRDEEYVVCALLHDIGDVLGSYNHADLAATLLQPFISEANLWMLQHHGIVQGHHFFHHIGLDRHQRDQLAGHVHYQRTLEFVDRYDNPAFDAAAAVLPISVFEPMLRRVLAQPVRSLYLAALD